MTLATRCPACGTVFRVVQDQLRVSQGWVRCGRCAEAFNALESMVDPPLARVPTSPTADPSIPAAVDTQMLAEPAPVPAWTPAPAPAPGDLPETTRGKTEWAPQPTVDAAAQPQGLVAAPSPALIELPPGVSFIASDGAVSLPAAAAADERDGAGAPADVGSDTPPAGDPPPTSGPTVVMSNETASAAAAGEAMPAVAGNAAVEAIAVASQSNDERAPSFIVQADRAERWRRPGVRRAMLLVSAIAMFGLGAQVALVFRDRLAVSVPWMRPALQQACATLGCRVGDFRQIESLSVESSGLQRVEGAPVYRLAVTLRNRAAVDVAAPALDLALTDVQGRQIARRVLQMSDLNLPLRYLKAGSELPIQVPLGINERQVSGYTVEIFYP